MRTRRHTPTKNSQEYPPPPPPSGAEVRVRILAGLKTSSLAFPNFVIASSTEMIFFAFISSFRGSTVHIFNYSNAYFIVCIERRKKKTRSCLNRFTDTLMKSHQHQHRLFLARSQNVFPTHSCGRNVLVRETTRV